MSTPERMLHLSNVLCGLHIKNEMTTKLLTDNCTVHNRTILQLDGYGLIVELHQKSDELHTELP
jgi:hypothetical protein